ncbi:hypothetical protein EON78_05115, partial [bacterium]
MILLNNNIFKKIRYLIIGGEALDRKLVSRLLNSNSSPQNILNGYGPTENTTFSCTFNVNKRSLEHANSVPIGSPLNNRKVYVLDSDLKPLPFGAIGELYV